MRLKKLGEFQHLKILSKFKKIKKYPNAPKKAGGNYTFEDDKKNSKKLQMRLKKLGEIVFFRMTKKFK